LAHRLTRRDAGDIDASTPPLSSSPKGCDVRILDPSVSLAQLVGANRRYIEEEIPHIASLMCEDIQQLLDHAEVLVVGSASREAGSPLPRSAPSTSSSI